MSNNYYQNQIKNPEWQKKRLEVLSLRGFKCETCGNDKEELHVHHRFYIKGRKIWMYDNDVLQVLCATCHKEEHEKQSGKNIPEKYKNLISLVERADLIKYDNLREIESLINAYIEYIDDKDFLSNLFRVCESEYLEKLKYDLTKIVIEEDYESYFIQK